MSNVFNFLAANSEGIVILLILVFTGGLALTWLLWMFGRGRFQRRQETAGGGKALRFVFADLLVKIIDDFRHLLALVIVVIFALALIFALVLVWNEPSGRLDALSKALQAVVSALGGLIGAIIGYYFGEKAGEKSAIALAKSSGSAPAQQVPQGPVPELVPAPEPPEQS